MHPQRHVGQGAGDVVRVRQRPQEIAAKTVQQVELALGDRLDHRPAAREELPGLDGQARGQVHRHEGGPAPHRARERGELLIVEAEIVADRHHLCLGVGLEWHQGMVGFCEQAAQTLGADGEDPGGAEALPDE